MYQRKQSCHVLSGRYYNFSSSIYQREQKSILIYRFIGRYLCQHFISVHKVDMSRQVTPVLGTSIYWREQC